MKYKSINIFIIFFYLLIKVLQEEECPKDLPIKYNNICQLKYCTEYEYINNNCIISNSLIKTQWLNNVILIGDISFKYINPLLDFNNNLIIFSSPYDDLSKTSDIYKIRKFYGIKSNGRPYFYNITKNTYESQITFNLNTPYTKAQSEVCFIKISDINNEGVFYNYFFILGMTDNYRELYDFEHNIMMGGPIGTFFRDNTTNKRYYIEASENKNEILFVFNGIDGGVYKLMFMGYRFLYNNNIQTYKYTYTFINDISDTLICSCLRTEKKNFGCFYVNNQKYYYFYFLQFTYSNLNDNPKLLSKTLVHSNDKQQNNELFYKCIHLKYEIGVFIYFIEENNLYIKLNELKISTNSYQLDTLLAYNINKYHINSYYDKCVIIKINDDRFLFASSSNDNYDLILLIFNLFNNDKNFFVAYYKISLELYNLEYYTCLRGIIFNNFIGLTFSALNNSISTEKSLTYFGLLGYINSTDPLPITNLFGEEDEYIFEIGKYVNVENNIFGYEVIGIKLINITEIKNNGMKLIDSKNNSINENDIISYENNITIQKSEISGVSFGNYILMFSGIISEAKNFSELIKYTEEIMFYNISNTELIDNFYDPKTLIGRIGFFNFTIESCYKTCSKCNNKLGNKNNHYCLNCSDEYPINYLNGKKCANLCKEINLYEYKNECINKCEDNTFIDEMSLICYDDCKYNTNNSRTIILNNTCIDKCPDEYILNIDTNICEKPNNIISTTIIMEDIPYEEEENNKNKEEENIFESNIITNKEEDINIESSIITNKEEENIEEDNYIYNPEKSILNDEDENYNEKEKNIFNENENLEATTVKEEEKIIEKEKNKEDEEENNLNKEKEEKSNKYNNIIEKEIANSLFTDKIYEECKTEK